MGRVTKCTIVLNQRTKNKATWVKLIKMAMFSDDLFNVFEETSEPKEPKIKKRSRGDNVKSGDTSKKAKVMEGSEAGASADDVIEDSQEEEM